MIYLIYRYYTKKYRHHKLKDISLFIIKLLILLNFHIKILNLKIITIYKLIQFIKYLA